MTRTREEMLELYRRLAMALGDTILEGGKNGAPAGVLYLALASRGLSIDVYNTIETALIASGKFVKCGDVLYGEEFAP